MSEPVLTSAEGVTLIGGGEVLAKDLAEARAYAPRLVAADGGADRALALGALPDAVIGDFDSLSEDARWNIPEARLHRIAEQDSTDFEKCLTRIRAPFVVAVGFAGGRVDHELAVLSTMARIAAPPVLLLGPKDVIFRAPADLRLDLPLGSRFSLFPFGACTGESAGLRWPIKGLDLRPDGIIGTSNEVTGPVHLRMSGPMLVILPREHLPAVLQALQGKN